MLVSKLDRAAVMDMSVSGINTFDHLSSPWIDSWMYVDNSLFRKPDCQRNDMLKMDANEVNFYIVLYSLCTLEVVEATTT